MKFSSYFAAVVLAYTAAASGDVQNGQAHVSPTRTWSHPHSTPGHHGGEPHHHKSAGPHHTPGFHTPGPHAPHHTPYPPMGTPSFKFAPEIVMRSASAQTVKLVNDDKIPDTGLSCGGKVIDKEQVEEAIARGVNLAQSNDPKAQSFKPTEAEAERFSDCDKNLMMSVPVKYHKKRAQVGQAQPTGSPGTTPSRKVIFQIGEEGDEVYYCGVVYGAADDQMCSAVPKAPNGPATPISTPVFTPTTMIKAAHHTTK